MQVDEDAVFGDPLHMEKVNDRPGDSGFEHQTYVTSTGDRTNGDADVLAPAVADDGTIAVGSSGGHSITGVLLDHSAYPCIVDRIMQYASNSVLGAFRGTSNQFKVITETLLYRHVALDGRIGGGTTALSFVDPINKTRISGLRCTPDLEVMQRVLKRIRTSTRVIDYLCPHERSDWVLSVNNRPITFDIGRFRLRSPYGSEENPYADPSSGWATICRFQRTICRLDVDLSDFAHCLFLEDLSGILFHYFQCFASPEITFVVNPTGERPIPESVFPLIVKYSDLQGFDVSIRNLANYLYWCGARTFTLVGLEALHPVAVVHPEVPQPDILPVISEALEDAYRNRRDPFHGPGTLTIDIVSKTEYEQRFSSQHERSLMLGEGL
ncbi:uncharacterized protein LOC62_01G001310 [Vanrija pseudolonga]|uniref:Uncharacterized protein n=1 Tax=Vanrija pseudolonga TaxID=143232 RepID=A0AAF1BIZ3_9TREE|nr:hypothetical protein LOC62_01G001310 [Vanrija pseudolonga]